MTDKQLRQAIINPTQILVSDGTEVESNLGYFNLGAIGRDLLATATQAEAQSVIGSTAGGSNENRLINGGMAIDQRNKGTAQTLTAGAALAYTVDRWYAYIVGANATGQRVQGATEGQFRYQIMGATGVTAIGFGQRIEQLNCADLAGQTATLSVDMANSLLTTVTWTAYYATTRDTFGTLASPTKTQFATGTFTVNSTVTRYSAPISVPIEATTGIEIVFTVGAQTSGTWTIGNVQLEKGDTANPFEFRPHPQELALCQRYHYQGTRAFSISTQGAATNGQVYPIIPFPLPVPMRVIPNLSPSDSYALIGLTGYANQTLTGTWAFTTDSDVLALKLDSPATGAFSLYITASAEL